MILPTWTSLSAAVRTALPPVTFPPVDGAGGPPGVPLSETHAAFRRLTAESVPEGTRSSAGGAALMGMPLIGDLSLEGFVGIAMAAGVATLLIRGLQRFWEIKNRPFGDLSELNRISAAWAVTNDDDALGQAWRLGDAFLKKVKDVRFAYENDLIQVPYTINPQDWGRIAEVRHLLTARYAREIGLVFQHFAKGLTILSRGDWGRIYQDIFGSFLHTVFLAFGPVSRWENPPTAEDEANLRHFQTVLRRETLALEMKLDALSEVLAA